MSKKTTNAMRILAREGLEFEVRSYPVDPNDLSAAKVAKTIGFEPARVFKTLACRAPGKTVVLAVIPGDQELSLKALARVAGLPKVELLPLAEVQGVTGYVRGAVTALGTKRPFPVFVDPSVERWPTVSISAGVRGQQILIAPADYLSVTGGRLAKLCPS